MKTLIGLVGIQCRGAKGDKPIAQGVSLVAYSDGSVGVGCSRLEEGNCIYRTHYHGQTMAVPCTHVRAPLPVEKVREQPE